MKILTDTEARIYLFEIGNFVKFDCYSKKDNQKVRASTEINDDIFVYRKRSKKWGKRWKVDDFVKEYYLPVTVSENEKWHKRINKVIKKIETSGLWMDKLEYLNNLKLLTYEDKKKIARLGDKYTYDDNHNKKYIHNEDENSAWLLYRIKYPFLFDENGELLYKYVWGELSEIKLKSMYFGKRDNKFIKNDIAEKICKREKVSHYARANYEVSFEYDGDTKAWYSEEYLNTGNGYYYLALDENTAWFIEND